MPEQDTFQQKRESQNFLEQPSQENRQEPDEESDYSASGGFKFLTPMAILMFSAAVLMDATGFMIGIVGLDDLGIIDIMAFISVGGLMFLDSGTILGTKKSEEASKKLLKRLGFSSLVEIIPWVGGLSPSWIIAVFFHLKNK